jgi:nucleotidyltransferase substrate binding protein (TIGR01987 family)
MVGDDMKDVEAARAASCKAILLTDKADADAPAFPSLAAFVNSEICGEKRMNVAIDEDIRWKQRFANYKKALVNLAKTVEWAKTHNEPDIVNLSIIKAFELTFELSWNVMKDFLKSKGNVKIFGSLDSVRYAFQNGLLSDGQVWMDMIKDSNKATHTYDLADAEDIVQKITSQYLAEFLVFAQSMENLE